MGVLGVECVSKARRLVGGERFGCAVGGENERLGQLAGIGREEGEGGKQTAYLACL